MLVIIIETDDDQPGHVCTCAIATQDNSRLSLRHTKSARKWEQDWSFSIVNASSGFPV
ncbi:hypothetical protein ACUL41_02670 [Virgibacillus natechei]